MLPAKGRCPHCPPLHSRCLLSPYCCRAVRKPRQVQGRREGPAGCCCWPRGTRGWLGSRPPGAGRQRPPPPCQARVAGARIFQNLLGDTCKEQGDEGLHHPAKRWGDGSQMFQKLPCFLRVQGAGQRIHSLLRTACLSSPREHSRRAPEFSQCLSARLPTTCRSACLPVHPNNLLVSSPTGAPARLPTLTH